MTEKTEDEIVMEHIAEDLGLDPDDARWLTESHRELLAHANELSSRLAGSLEHIERIEANRRQLCQIIWHALNALRNEGADAVADELSAELVKALKAAKPRRH